MKKLNRPTILPLFKKKKTNKKYLSTTCVDNYIIWFTVYNLQKIYDIPIRYDKTCKNMSFYLND